MGSGWEGKRSTAAVERLETAAVVRVGNEAVEAAVETAAAGTGAVEAAADTAAGAARMRVQADRIQALVLYASK